MTNFTVSDQARAILAIEEERDAVWAEAACIARKQMEIMNTANREIAVLSNKHKLLLERMQELTEASDLIIQSVGVKNEVIFG